MKIHQGGSIDKKTTKGGVLTKKIFFCFKFPTIFEDEKIFKLAHENSSRGEY